jgi:hypothetical protein
VLCSFRIDRNDVPLAALLRHAQRITFTRGAQTADLEADDSWAAYARLKPDWEHSAIVNGPLPPKDTFTKERRVC